MLKKTSLVSAYNGLQHCSFCCSHPATANISSTSPQNLPAQRARPQAERVRKRQRVSEPLSWLSRRNYATVRGSNGVDFRDNMNWPCRNGQPVSTTGSNPSVPNPYEIFDMHRAERYGRSTKLKYYELVKIYHPDRTSISDNSGLNRLELLERYRLIVLAHEIISDPEKRRAYDAYGAGWGTRTSTTRHSRGFSSSASGKQYGQGAGFDNSPFGNATWEDWERWYRRQSTDEQKQTYAGTYVNPNAFAAFVITVAVLSGILQATRVTSMAGTYADKQLAFTEETSRFMTQRATQFEDNKIDKDGRIKHFLERRDPTRFGLKEEEETAYRKHFQNSQDALPLGRPRPEVTDNARPGQSED